MRAFELMLMTVASRSCVVAPDSTTASATYSPTCSSTPAAHPDITTYCVDDVVAFIDKVTYESVHDAVSDASTGDSIYICPGEHDAAIKLSKANLTLAAASGEASNTALTGDGAAQIIGGTRAKLSVYNLTLRDGYAINGGAIGLSLSTVALSCVDFEDNIASSDGGAVWMEQGTLTLDTATFTDNTAGGDGGGVWIGGSYPSTLSVTDSTFTDNAADSGGALALGEAAFGDDFSIVDSDLEGNIADTEGGAILLSTTGWAVLTLDGATLSDNEAADGGGLAVTGDADEYDIWIGQTELDGNTAGAGAAVYVSDDPDMVDLDFYESAVVANVADGAAVEVSDDTVTWSFDTSWGATGSPDDNSEDDFDGDCGARDDLGTSETFLCTLDGSWVTP